MRIAVEDIGLVLAQAFQCLSLLLGEVDRARNVSVGIVFGGVDVYNIHLVVLHHAFEFNDPVRYVLR